MGLDDRRDHLQNRYGLIKNMWFLKQNELVRYQWCEDKGRNPDRDNPFCDEREKRVVLMEPDLRTSSWPAAVCE